MQMHRFKTQPSDPQPSEFPAISIATALGGNGNENLPTTKFSARQWGDEGWRIAMLEQCYAHSTVMVARIPEST